MKRNEMKKMSITLAGVSLMALLSACGSSNDTTSADPQPVVTVTAQPEPEAPSGEAGFLSAIHALNNPLFESESDSAILEVGHSTCDALSANNTVSDVVDYLSSSGDYKTDDEIQMVAGMIAASVIHLCPEFQYQLPE